MYIDIGGEIAIRSRDLIAILDGHLLQQSEIMKEFVGMHGERISREEYKSLVVTTGQVYFSPLSASTLSKRAK